VNVPALTVDGIIPMKSINSGNIREKGNVEKSMIHFDQQTSIPGPKTTGEQNDE
jgi:hypothetical protein